MIYRTPPDRVIGSIVT